MHTQTIEELRAEIAANVTYANNLMRQIAQLLADRRFAAASIQTDYLQGQIKSAERIQKRIAKLEAG